MSESRIGAKRSIYKVCSEFIFIHRIIKATNNSTAKCGRRGLKMYIQIMLLMLSLQYRRFGAGQFSIKIKMSDRHLISNICRPKNRIYSLSFFHWGSVCLVSLTNKLHDKTYYWSLYGYHCSRSKVRRKSWSTQRIKPFLAYLSKQPSVK